LPEQLRRAAEIRTLVERSFGKDLTKRGEDAFAFVGRLSSKDFLAMRDPRATAASGQVDLPGWSVRGDASVDPRVTERVSSTCPKPWARSPAKAVQ
jgi:hypothetical protein